MVDPRPSRRRYEIALWIDRRVGPVICALLLGAKRLLGRRRTPTSPDEVDRILLLKMWGMGSVVLASPLLAKLRSRYPNARIDFLSLRENEPLLQLYPQIDRVIAIDLGSGIPRFLVQTLRAILAIRRERYDLLLDLEFFTRFSAIFSFLAQAAWSHGFSAKGSWRGKLHDLEVPFNAYHHVAQNFLTLLDGDYRHPVEADAGAGAEMLPKLVPDEQAWESCRRRLAEDPAWREGEAIVVVNPNAGDMAIERRWPSEQVTQLLQHLAGQRDVNLVLIGSPAERRYVESIVRSNQLASRVVNLAGRSDVAELVALLAHASVVVTNDSGPMHVACAAGASTVALFGPETPTLYGPLRAETDQRHVVHYLGLACSPCMFVHDNKVLSCWFAQARCMTGIAPADVLESVNALLDGTRGAAAPHLRVIEP